MLKRLKKAEPKPPPTDEMVAIYDLVKKREKKVLVGAFAGTGKTSMLEGMIPFVKPPWLYLAFNNSVVKEAEDRLPSGGLIKTFNGMGLKCWGTSNAQGATTNPNKMFEMFKQYISDNIKSREDREHIQDSFVEILAAISMAKNLGYVPDGKYPNARRLCTWEEVNRRIERPLDEFETEVCIDLLHYSIQAAYAGAVDFNDQVYMPALFGGTFPRFPNVLVDERQDLSPTNYALLERLVTDWLAAVGDRWQSIYRFRGATADGGDIALKKYDMHEMPLSYSFRCPENIVKAVHWRVPLMRWVKTGGTYEVLSSLNADEIPDGAAIISRNNAPLLRAAFGLLSRKRSVSVAGSDIGNTVIRLLAKIGHTRDTREDLLAKIDAWRDHQLQKTNAPASVYDKAECMKIFASWGKDLSQALAYAKHIFEQRGKIFLTTGHKAKGMEWDTCYHLDPQLINMKDEQDQNLKYVITTRAKQELYEIKTEELQW